MAKVDLNNVNVNRNYRSSGTKVNRLGDTSACSFLGQSMAEHYASIPISSTESGVRSKEKRDSIFKECGIEINESAIFEKESVGTKAYKEGIIRGTFKEELTSDNGSGAYVTFLSKTIFHKAWDQLSDILELVIVFDDLKGTNGYGSIQIPIGQPTVAFEVAEGEIIDRFEEGISEITITARQIVSATAITWRLRKRALPSVVSWIMNNAVNAVVRKISEDIVLSLVAGAGFTQTGLTTTGAYDAIIQAEAQVNGATISASGTDGTSNNAGVYYGFQANHLVLSYEGNSVLKRDDDWKSHVQYAIIQPGRANAVDRPTEYFNKMKITVVPYFPTTGADANVDGLVLDSRYAMAWVPEADFETYEAQITGRPYDREIVVLASIGMAVLYPRAICKVSTA